MSFVHRTDGAQTNGIAARLAEAVCALLLLAVASGYAAATETPRAIDWEDLVPALPPVTDPLSHLPPDQRLDLHAIAGIRHQASLGLISEVSDTYEMSVELTHKLARQGVDVERLISKLKAAQAEMDRQDRMVVDGLESQIISIPGFALPLEFAGTAVKEFLLVPFIGACIHVPPPPPNQMVYVTLDKPRVFEDIYTPVVVTGRMSVTGATKSLSLVDGQANVDAGYSMTGTKIELYRE